MINDTSTPRSSGRRRVAGDGDAVPEQLTLLATPATPARFRLSRDTRERGLRHVAEIRAMLDARRLDHAERTNVRALPRRQDRAA